MKLKIKNKKKIYLQSLFILLFLGITFLFLPIFYSQYNFYRQHYDFAYYYLEKFNDSFDLFFPINEYKINDSVLIYNLTKNFADVEKVIKKGYPYNERLMFLYGMYYFYNGKIDLAIDIYKTMLKNNPKNKKAKINLEILLIYKKDIEKNQSFQKTESENSYEKTLMHNILEDVKSQGFEEYKEYLNSLNNDQSKKNW